MLIACATTENTQENQSNTSTTKIVGGKTEVGFKNIVMSLSESGELCTGSLIAPNLVLTAGHCVFNRSLLDQNPNDFAKHIYIGNNTNGMKIPVIKSIAHLEYKKPRGEADDQNSDIALLVLASDVRGIDPLPITALRASHLIGEDLLAIGFGLSDEINQRGAGTKRSVTLQVTQALENRFIAERKGAQEQDTCSGDSGGPGLVNIDGTWVILGTVKRGGGSGCVGLTYYVQVSAHLDWINTVARDHQIVPPTVINGDFFNNESEWAKLDPSKEPSNDDRGTWANPEQGGQSNDASGYHTGGSDDAGVSDDAGSNQVDSSDGCALNGYYGDGRCDNFCDQPDPDCENSVLDECLNSGYYGDGTCDTFCSQPDPDCDATTSSSSSSSQEEEDICELYGFYGDGECDTFCLYQDADCDY